MTLLVIELRAHELICARYRRQRRNLHFLGAERHPRLPGEAIAPLLAPCRPTGREEVRVVLCLPPAWISLREIALPVTDRRKARELLPLELRGETAQIEERLSFDAISLANGRFMAVWTRREQLAGIIDDCAAAGLEPAVITSAPLCWGELAADLGRETFALCDGEALVIFREGQPLYHRTLGSEEPATEVVQTLALMQLDRGIAVPRVFLLGKSAREGLELPPETADAPRPAVVPLPPTKTGEAPGNGDETSYRDLASTYAVARSVTFATPVDFRSGELAYTADRQRLARRLRLTFALAAALAILLLVEAGLRVYLERRDLDSVNRSITTIYREVFPNRTKPVDAVGEMRVEIRRLGSAAAGGQLLPLLKLLAEAKEDAISGIFDVELEKGHVQVKGDAATGEAVTAFKGRAAAIVRDPQVSEQKSRGDGSVSFTLRGSLKEAGR